MATSFIPIPGTNAPPPKLLVIFRAVAALPAFMYPGPFFSKLPGLHSLAALFQRELFRATVRRAVDSARFFFAEYLQDES